MADAEHPLLEVTGSHRAIGRQIGEAFRAQIQARLAETPGLEPQRHWAEKQGLIRGILTASERAFPHLVEELRGLADGAHLAFEDLLVLNCRGELRAAAEEGCSSIIVKDPACLLIGHNEDGSSIDRGRMFLLRVRPPSGVSFLVFCYPGMLGGNAAGINERGIAQSVNNLRPAGVRAGIGRHFLTRAILEAATLDEAVRIAGQAGRAYGFHHNLAGRQEKKAFGVETTPLQQAVTAVEGIYFHTNHYTAPELQTVPTHGAGSLSSIPRLEELKERVGAQRPRSLDELAGVLGCRPPHPRHLCRHPQGPDNSCTLAFVGMDLLSGIMRVTAAAPCSAAFKEYRI